MSACEHNPSEGWFNDGLNRVISKQVLPRGWLLRSPALGRWLDRGKRRSALNVLTYCRRKALCRSASSWHGIQRPLFSCTPSHPISRARFSASAFVSYMPFPWGNAGDGINTSNPAITASDEIVVCLRVVMALNQMLNKESNLK